MSSLHLKKPKKAKEKAAQSMTVSIFEGMTSTEEVENALEDKKSNGQTVVPG